MWYNPRHEISRLDVTEIELDLVNNGVSYEDPFDDDQELSYRQVYIGTIMCLTPSGKYYTPWACSNVEVCKECAECADVPCTADRPCDREGAEGSGHCEACLDAAWWAQLEEDLEDINAWVVPSEGCATDVLVVTPWDDHVSPEHEHKKRVHARRNKRDEVAPG